MKIQDLLKELRFADSETSQIKDSNPKQIISTELRVPVWRIKYSYLTARNNERESTKYIFEPEENCDLVEKQFDDYIKELNEKFPYKAISNVKILDMSYIGDSFLELE